MTYLRLIILGACFFSVNFAYAATLNQQAAMKVVEQMGSAISTRYKKTIENFFKYYSTTDANFITTTIAIDPDNSKFEQEKTYSRNRQEYIEHVVEMTSNFQAYSYIPTLQNFTYDVKQNIAIVQIAVEEQGLTYPPVSNSERVVIKTKVATNCNITMIVASGSPLINGMSCIEKIVVQ